MKTLLKIWVWGTLAFLAVAIVQEWSYFSEAWFGPQPTGSELKDTERKAAADTVYQMLAMMEHFYASGGDRRFSERIPASSTVVEEMIDDVRYLGRNHMVEQPSLKRLEITAVEPVPDGRVEIHTRELWSIRFLSAKGDGMLEPNLPYLAYRKYLLSRGPRGWIVDGWDLPRPETARSEVP